MPSLCTLKRGRGPGGVDGLGGYTCHEWPERGRYVERDNWCRGRRRRRGGEDEVEEEEGELGSQIDG